MIHQLIALALMAKVIQAAPLPAVITRYHTAQAVTTTETYTTGTTTLWLPPVELFISNGVSYTFTLSNEQWATTPQTRTSIVDSNTGTPAAPAPGTTTSSTAPTQTGAPAPQQTTQQQPAPQQASETSSQAPQPQPSSQAPQPQPSSSHAAGAAPQPSTNQVSTDAQPTSTSSTAPAPQLTSTEAPAPQPTSTSSTSYAQPSTTSLPEPSSAGVSISVGTTIGTSSTAATSSTSSTWASSSSASLPSSSSSGNLTPPSVIVYSPYQSSGACKDQGTIDSDLEYIFSKGIKKLRIYGTDCNLFTATLPKCSQLGMTVNQGLWFTPGQGADSIDSDVQDIINYGTSEGWSVFDIITVGNEAINDNVLTVAELTAKIASVKQQLNSNGYNGHITTSEPPVSFTNNPQLCTDSVIDVVGINPHSYFDVDVNASQAGSFVAGQKQLVEGVCGSKQVIITETGYPSQGDQNGENQPSPANQYIAIKSILDSTGGDVTILTTYNDFWKQPGPYGIEQYFGAIQLFD